MIISSIDPDRLLAIVAGVATIVSSSLAIYQSLRYRVARKDLKRIKREIKNRLWGDIHLTLQIFDSLDEAKLMFEGKLDQQYTQELIPTYLYHKILAARKCSVASYLRLLEQRINEEESFNAETVEQWHKLGLLQNEWRKKAAYQFIDTPQPPKKSES